MATTPPMYTTGISTLSPASTYPDLLLVNNAGQGLNNTPSQVQDGLGNRTNMTISSNYINFDRSVSQFQLDGVALTASAATLNNVSDVANGQYVLLNSNVQLPNASVLSATNGISLSSGAGSVMIQPDLASPLGQIQQLVGGPNGILVYQNDEPFSTVNLISDATINITNPDGTTGNPTFSVIPDTSVQRVNVQLNGVFESRKSQLNFIPGPGSGINVVDNPSSNRTDITISGVPGSAFNFVAAVYATTTANLVSNYNNGASGVGATLTSTVDGAFTTDGQNPVQNDVILVKDQTTPAQNGIYLLTTVGDVGNPWILTRANYFDSPVTIKPGDIAIVLHGDIYQYTGWVETAKVNVVGTDPINFVTFGVTGTITSVTGTVDEIDVANPTSTPVVSISPTYVGQASITTVGTIDTGVWNGTPVTVPFGGTGRNSTTAYGVLCGGTTATNPLQNAGTGLLNQIFVSNGIAALPSWQNINASKAQQIAGASNIVYTTPSVQQYHNSAAKAWVRFLGSNGAIQSSYNIASVIRNGFGNYTITFTNPFSDTSYICLPSTEQQVGVTHYTRIIRDTTTITTTQSRLQAYNVNFAASDPYYVDAAFFGLQ